MPAAHFAELTPSSTPHEYDDRRAELRRVTGRLWPILENHQQQAARLGETLTPQDVLKVLDALEKHARGGAEPTFLSADGNSAPTVKDCLLDGLYQDLNLEPSNVLYHQQTGPETIRYEAMQAEFWIDCLGEVRARLVGR
jgi:hypothetical protein